MDRVRPKSYPCGTGAVNPDLTDAVRRASPLVIKAVEFHDPVLVVSGEDWGLTTMCPWRVLRDGDMEMSWSTANAEDRAWDLVGRAILAAPQCDRDPVFEMSGGSRLELFSDTDIDPWNLRLPGITFVGPLRRA